MKSSLPPPPPHHHHLHQPFYGSHHGEQADDNNDEGWVAKFVPFSSSVDTSFWIKYCREKLETIRLDEAPIVVRPYWIPTGTRMYCQELSFPSSSSSDEEEEGSQQEHQQKYDDTDGSSFFNDRVAVRATLTGYNSIESFTGVDKNQLLRDAFLPAFLDSDSDKLNNDNDSKVLESLTRGVILTFADLKNFRVVYWFAFPSFATPIRVRRCDTLLLHNERISVEAPGVDLDVDLDLHSLGERVHKLRASLPRSSSLFPYFLLSNDNCFVLSKEAYDGIEDKESVIFGYFDPTRTQAAVASAGADPQPVMGWPMRNLVAYLSFHLRLGGRTARVLSYRPKQVRRIVEPHPPEGSSPVAGGPFSIVEAEDSPSYLLHVRVPTKGEYAESCTSQEDASTSTTPSYPIVGWELNARGKPGPRAVNLRPLLDTKHLAIQAADLNLKLMKWRMIPNLQVELLQGLRVLILGAGTLGCTVSRVLLGWGVRDFTIVDNSVVSYSNPVRQSLFTLKDCAVNAPKAEAAARALDSIAANVSSRSHVLSIPMPGHPERDHDALKESVSKIDALVKECDAVFLLTDTRESRWLPTVAATAHDKMLINAALGLDSWLVMRHGGGFAASSDNPPNRLGCYFCNDVVAPENSTRNRTLDQQCTVTRPGLAPIASSMAVELMVALFHHPERLAAAPPPASSAQRNFSPTVAVGQNSASGSSSSDLGLIPHQIRGSLVSYTMMTPTVPAFLHCTACSRPVVQAYQESAIDLVSRACSSTDGAFLDDLSGLSEFRAQATAMLEELDVEDWDADDE
jgi:ubiquitin-like modifier-activating enzyme ATG7